MDKEVGLLLTIPREYNDLQYVVCTITCKSFKSLGSDTTARVLPRDCAVNLADSQSPRNIDILYFSLVDFSVPLDI